jgi:hypothetical protein
MGLRFFCVGRWGWVRRNADLISESAHPPEKSERSFMNPSIHRLSYCQVNLREVGASSRRERSS